ncbi:MAG TPA: GTP 3',8-cyclase MoaA [Candidatus Methanofastidiosa archaeon]|nr:GTP 3',8-cyclase MoaA [Candidatus Methanofastidiosa archaeon]HPR41430.1 GTP 3',8-cyclase MoaA [Candidatus Methanofastidiosa archaeon]
MNAPNGIPIRNIRISLTKRCNLKCFYCHREGELIPKGVPREITVEEIENLLEVSRELGIDKVRFTGGEPLVRKDIIEVVEAASRHMDDVSLSTNGTLLAPIAKDLKDAGLDRINVTLNSLKPDIFSSMVGADALSDAVDGVEKAYEAGINPIKINMVVVKRNCGEIPDMISYLRPGMILQLIELIASKDGEADSFYLENHVDFGPIEKYLEEHAERIEVRQKHKRKRYCLPQVVEIVRSMHNSTFCQHCNSIRVTSEGKVKKCLFNNDLKIIDDFSDKDSIRRVMESTIMEKRPYW